MRLESINIGRTETIVFDGKSMQTGICKEPVKGPVQVTVDGLPDDAILAVQHHGGPDQAIYAYSSDDYDWWSQVTGKPFYPGLFGENLTDERAELFINALDTDLRVTTNRPTIGARSLSNSMMNASRSRRPLSAI